MGSLIIPAGTSLKQVHDTFCREIDEVCSLLSLAYRQPVDHYEVEYIVENKNEARSSALLRQRWPSQRHKSSNDPLLHASNLADEGLQTLLNALRSCPDSGDLIRAITFLTSSYETTLEIGYFMAFSAMETVVNAAIGESAKPLGSSTWKPIERLLTESIQQRVSSNDLDVDIGQGLIQKLPELKRPSFKSKVEIACKKLNPKTEDLWPERGFLDGLSGAALTRNGLFHDAGSSIDDNMYDDLVRVRTFTERLMLRLLKWPDDRIWTWYDQDLKRVNQQRRQGQS